MRAVLAVDLGSSNLRAALVDECGRLSHLQSIPAPQPDADASGRSEIRADTWWDGFNTCVAAVAASAGASFEHVAAVAISGVTRTQILLGAEQRPLRPAITWADTSATPLLPEFLALAPSDDPETKHLNTFHPAARLAAIARSEPDILERTTCVLEPKDYINLRLTGRAVTDHVSSARLRAAVALLPPLGVSPRIVPQAVPPTEVIGRVAASLAEPLARLAGRPVMAMGTDTWAAVIGLGALRNGFAYNLSGTTEVFGVLSRTAAQADGLLSVDFGNGLFQLGGPSQNGGDTVVWLTELLAIPERDIGAALHRLLAAPRDPQDLLFLPYLQGERVPYWDPSLRGAFIGLHRRHGPGDLARAALEGIAFVNRIVLERAESAIGQAVAEIRFGGGGAANAAWCQIKADICARLVTVVDTDEPGLTGAGLVAWAALNHDTDLAEVQSALPLRRSYQPSPDSVAAYDRLYALFRAAEAAVGPLSHALVASQR
jgi:xylulokinase